MLGTPEEDFGSKYRNKKQKEIQLNSIFPTTENKVYDMRAGRNKGQNQPGIIQQAEQTNPKTHQKSKNISAEKRDNEIMLMSGTE